MSIIGRKYTPQDGSYSVNLTKAASLPHVNIHKDWRENKNITWSIKDNRNAQAIVVSEPFSSKIFHGCMILNYQMVLIQFEEDTYSTLYRENWLLPEEKGEYMSSELRIALSGFLGRYEKAYEEKKCTNLGEINLDYGMCYLIQVEYLAIYPEFSELIGRELGRNGYIALTPTRHLEGDGASKDIPDTCFLPRIQWIRQKLGMPEYVPIAKPVPAPVALQLNDEYVATFTKGDRYAYISGNKVDVENIKNFYHEVFSPVEQLNQDTFQIYLPNRALNSRIMQIFRDSGWNVDDTIVSGEFAYPLFYPRERMTGGNYNDYHTHRTVSLEEALTYIYSSRRIAYQINEEYEAVYIYGEDSFKVGCQTFPLKALSDLYDMICK